MGAAENKAIVGGTYEAFGRGDMDAIYAAFAEDAIWSNHSSAASPSHGQYQGKDALRQYFASTLDSMEITKFDLHTLVADGDHVVALLDQAFTVKSTGKSHEGPLVHVCELRDGKIVRVDEFEGDLEVW
jgi:ketosteroid isomerase-like protein